MMMMMMMMKGGVQTLMRVRQVGWSSAGELSGGYLLTLYYTNPGDEDDDYNDDYDDDLYLQCIVLH